MTDLMLKTLQHHVNEKESLTIEQRLSYLEDFFAELQLNDRAKDKEIFRLKKRIKSLEQWRAGANSLIDSDKPNVGVGNDHKI